MSSETPLPSRPSNGRLPSRLRDERLAQGLRLVDVAGEADVSVGLLSMIENGYVPKPAVRERIAVALGKRPQSFWPGVEA